ncbi:MAG: PIN domain-containing protein [Balneola sp.]
MKKIFIDSDIFLDVIENRLPFANDSSKVFDRVLTDDFSIFTSAICFANIYYIAGKNIGLKKAKEMIREFKSLFRIIPTSDQAIQLSLHSEFSDLEDAIQHFTAKENGMNLIITRNKKHYSKSEIPVLTPSEFLASLN